MPLGNNSIIRITLKGTGLDQQWLNVFHYQQSTPVPATVAEIAAEFWNNIKAAWDAFMPDTPEWLAQSVLAEEIGGDQEFYEYIIPTLEQRGGRSFAGQLEPSFIGVGMKLVPANRLVRPGSKRFGGASEDVKETQTWAASYVTLANALGTALMNDLTYGTLEGAIANLVIYGDVLEPSDRNPEGRPDPVVVDVVNFTVSPYVTTQNSRKIGRGV